MSVEYTMFGYDEEKNPVVATNVTTTEAKAFAEAKRVTGFFLSPQRSGGPSAGIVSYEQDNEGVYRKVTLRHWTANNHLAL